MGTRLKMETPPYRSDREPTHFSNTFNPWTGHATILVRSFALHNFHFRRNCQIHHVRRTRGNEIYRNPRIVDSFSFPGLNNSQDSKLFVIIRSFSEHFSRSSDFRGENEPRSDFLSNRFTRASTHADRGHCRLDDGIQSGGKSSRSFYRARSECRWLSSISRVSRSSSA